MKNKLELKLYKLIKYFFIAGAIVMPVGLLFLKFALKEDINWIIIIVFPIMCLIPIKYMSFAIRVLEQRMEKQK